MTTPIPPVRLVHPWSRGRFLAEGAWRFALVGLAGFAPWACAGAWLHARIGEAGLYAACLLGFLLAAGPLLAALVQPPGRRRALAVFVPAFLAYGLLWCAGWFAIGGRAGDLLGSLAGDAAFVLVTAWRLRPPRAPLATMALFILAQSAGYFAGGEAMRLIAAAGGPGVAAMLAWGLCHGLGFGLGLGHLYHACQQRGPAEEDAPAGCER